MVFKMSAKNFSKIGKLKVQKKSSKKEGKIPNSKNIKTSCFKDSEGFYVFSFLGLEPMPKERHRYGSGVFYTSQRTQFFENSIKSPVKEFMKTQKLLLAPIEISLILYFSIPQSWPNVEKEMALKGFRVPTRRPDWDNVAKAITDSLNGLVYKDDSQIVSVFVCKRYGPISGFELKMREIQGCCGGFVR